MKFFIALLSSLSLVTIAFAEDGAPEETSRKTQKIESHACFGATGPERSICRLEQGRGTATRREMGGVGRRVQALLQRRENQRSNLIPKWMPLSRARNIDLRSTRDQSNDLARSRKMRMIGTEPAEKPETSRGSLIQRRALSGTRQEATEIACRAMNGLRLLACLRERGIEMNERTVDRETWELYLDQQPAEEISPPATEPIEEEPVQE